MRLLDVQTYKLHTFYDDNIPPYAILSHTWLQENEEVTFSHLQSQPLDGWSRLLGAQKITFTCRQAAQDGYSWAWVDTCCIDKTNNAELSEAINSMFRWYKRSKACYVYLMDVDVTGDNNDMLASRWWSRAWTLQELVAPTYVHFFDTRWRPMGTKTDHAESIANTKNIDDKTLHDPDSIFYRSVARRMSWAAHRNATRNEDLAYSLLGIFDINMTMQYGEGENAFLRLQTEITRTTNDMSIFSWGFTAATVEDICSDPTVSQQQSHRNLNNVISYATNINVATHGLYAAHPREFADSHDIVHLVQHVGGVGTEVKHGMQIINTAMILSPDWTESRKDQWAVVLLPCFMLKKPHCLIGILLRRWHRDHHRTMRRSFVRNVYTCLVSGSHTHEAEQQELRVDTLATQHSMWHSKFGSAPSLTLVIRFDNIRDFPFELLDSISWQKDERDSHCFMVSGYSIDSIMILRFHKPNSPLAVYTGFRLDPAIKDHSQMAGAEVVSSAIMALPASTEMDSLSENIRAAIAEPKRVTAIGPRNRCRSICGHDRLYLIVTLRIIFNQAVTTVTLGKRALNESVSSQDELCLKREEWFSGETQTLSKKPRKKGLLSWTK